MKLFLMTLVVIVLLFSAVSSLMLSNSCQKRAEACGTVGTCCPSMGVRMVCAKHLEICGKKTCCITEVEEQQEKQAAILRDRNQHSKRFWSILLDEVEE